MRFVLFLYCDAFHFHVGYLTDSVFELGQGQKQNGVYSEKDFFHHLEMEEDSCYFS